MRAFLTNVASLLMGNLFSQAVGVIFSIVMVQRLSNSDYALQSAILAFTSIVMGIADLGLYDVATRELTRYSGEKQHEVYNNLFSLQVLLSGTICTIAAFIAWLLNSFPGDQFVVFTLGLFTLVFSYAPIIPTEALMAARGRVRQIALIQTFYALFTVLIGVPLLLAGSGIEPIYIALSILSFITIGLYFREMRSLFPGGIRLTIRLDNWKYYLSQSIPTGLGSALQMSSLRLGTYLMYTFVNKEDTSYLGVSYLIVTGVLSIVWVPYAINIMPIMIRLYTRSKEQLVWLSGRSMVLLLAATLPVCIGTSLLAPEILALISPNQIGAAPTLRLYIWVLPPAIYVGFLYRILVIMERPRLYMWLAGCGAAISAIFCFLLIPGYGSQGAALAAIIGISSIALMLIWVLRVWLFSAIRILDALRLIVALGAMGVAVQASAGLPVLLRVGIGMLTYVPLLLLSGLFTATDRQMTRSLLASAQEVV
jgi:O-antigen/teichoic acid export membrane protein